MAIKIENAEEIREIKDVEAWLEKLLIDYLGTKEGYIYPIKEVMGVVAIKAMPDWPGEYSHNLLMQIILKLVKEGKIKAFEYKGTLCIGL